MASALCLILALAGCTLEAPDARPGAGFYARLDQGASLDIENARATISAYRLNKGRAVLALDPALMARADAQARSLAARDALRPGTTAPAAQPSSTVASASTKEITSAGYRTFAEAFSGWRDSPQHNAVMLDAGTRLGIAAAPAPASKYGVYWVLIVGR